MSKPAGNPPEYGAPISFALAKKVMEAAEQEAVAQQWPMVIAIMDSAGNLVMLHKMDQAQRGSVAIAQGKAQTALDFRRPTRAFEEAIAAGGVGVRVLSMPGVVALEGGIPIFDAGGAVIGAIGVSGMQSPQDAQVAVAGAKVALAQ